ncbi:hypothetical protein LEP1GSC052_0127 [Leptospira kmetyi serovar Malaysia str. Bejo-Iso9]|nr:hypothetical protein LEP1GSC052_0127 [Leptospira kmetyi serovar Malaysia str. Bejo-Iso9]
MINSKGKSTSSLLKEGKFLRYAKSKSSTKELCLKQKNIFLDAI